MITYYSSKQLNCIEERHNNQKITNNDLVCQIFIFAYLINSEKLYYIFHKKLITRFCLFIYAFAFSNMAVLLNENLFF